MSRGQTGNPEIAVAILLNKKQGSNVDCINKIDDYTKIERSQLMRCNNDLLLQ